MNTHFASQSATVSNVMRRNCAKYAHCFLALCSCGFGDNAQVITYAWLSYLSNRAQHTLRTYDKNSMSAQVPVEQTVTNGFPDEGRLAQRKFNCCFAHRNRIRRLAACCCCRVVETLTIHILIEHAASGGRVTTCDNVIMTFLKSSGTTRTLMMLIHKHRPSMYVHIYR